MVYTGITTNQVSQSFNWIDLSQAIVVPNPRINAIPDFFQPDIICRIRSIGASLTMQIDAAICSAGQHVAIEVPREVADYLLEYPELITWVEKIAKETANKFRPSSKVILQVYKDPEINFRYLCLLIRQQVYQENLMAEINSFSQQYDDDLAILNGTLLITTDFQPA